MRNVLYVAATIAIAMAIFANMQQQKASAPVDVRIDQAETPIKVKAESSIDDWVIKPTVHLISTPADGWGTGDSEPELDAKTDKLIDDLAKGIGDFEAKLTSTQASVEQRLDVLEAQMQEAKTDITDLSNGQADLTKRVEELTALIEVRTSSGEVKTKAVTISPTGSQFLLSAGEVITHIDGVPVAPVRVASGGSTGSFTASTTTSTAQYGSPPVATTSGGSNGSLQYSTQSYQTQSYNVSSQPVGTQQQVQIAPRRPLQQLRANGPLRSRFAPQASAPQCVGPECDRPN